MELFKELLEYRQKSNEILSKCCQEMQQQIWDTGNEIVAKLCSLDDVRGNDLNSGKEGELFVTKSKVMPGKDYSLKKELMQHSEFNLVYALLERCYDCLSQRCGKEGNMMGNDYLFDKGQANFWAEKLTEVRRLSKHLLLLIPVTHVGPCEQRKLYRLARSASDQAKFVTQLLKEMPPTPEFSQSVEFTKLAIQDERISLCLKMLSLLEVGNGTCKS